MNRYRDCSWCQQPMGRVLTTPRVRRHGDCQRKYRETLARIEQTFDRWVKEAKEYGPRRYRTVDR